MGKRTALSNGRRLVDDVIGYSRKMPLAAFVREMDLSKVHLARRRLRPRISWNVLFMKAYSIVAKETPELRTCYLRHPWPHFYTADYNVCMITIAREFEGETRLLFARFTKPENQTLLQLHNLHESYWNDAVEDFKQFRHQIRFAKFPHILRRLVWSSIFNFFPKYRLNNFGTFGMSISGFNKAIGTKSLSPCTTTLGIDPIARKGQSKFLFTFDHRVLDGKPAIDVMDRLESVLRGPICDELNSLIVRQTKNRASKASHSETEKNPIPAASIDASKRRAG